VARLDAREGVVRAGRVEGWHDAVESSAYSPGGRWGYIARDGDSLVVMVNGRVAARGQWGAHFAFRRGARHPASGVAWLHRMHRHGHVALVGLWYESRCTICLTECQIYRTVGHD